ncbi:MAG: glycerophosphodiester phosphodiesterase family protein [Alphaproteobacteria bacterium]
MIALTRVIGHRGEAAVAPENTLAGLEAAAAAGARWVEIDVRLSADKVCVLSHDPTLIGITPIGDERRMRIARTSAAALGALDIGTRFSADFAGETMPTLAAALDRAGALGLGVNIEVKDCGLRNRALADAIAAVLADRRRGAPDLLVSSFRPSILARLRARDPALALGLLSRGFHGGWRRRADALGCVSLHCAAARATAAQIADFKATGRMVAAYTVNDPALARRLFGWGVDAIFCGDPGRMLAALEQKTT